MKDKRIRFELRRERTRRKVRAAANGLPRLTVHRSLKYFYAQVVDDTKGVTLASASSAIKDLRGTRKSCGNLADAKTVGRLVAERALKAGVKQVVFDRGGKIYHGRIKALADAARTAGLKL
jgi:large subunit ribosomal protein L18